MHQLDAQLKDPNSELRQLLARLIRSEAKNVFSLMTGNELEIFDRLLAVRVSQALSSLGSAAPVADSTVPVPDNAESLNRAMREAIWRVERELRKVMYVLPAGKVCWNSACATRDIVPHMLDERDHRIIGEVAEEARDLKEKQ